MKFLDKLLKHFELSEEEYNKMIRPLCDEDLPSYTKFNGVESIIGRLEKAIVNKEKVIIYGDYDCDGIMSVSILVKAFAMVDFDVKYYIPSRYKDGYGLNVKNVEAIAAKGYSLIITVDNGISALEAVKRAKELGIDVIVTDHHEQILEELPDTPYIMHPIISNYGEVYCCGAYVAYMLATAILGRHDPYLLSLSSLATISDMMPLKEYNRDVVRLGMEYINKYRFIPIMNLVSNKETVVDENTVGLEIAPKINSVGRMKEDIISMQRIVRYFVTNNSEDLEELRCFIEETNNNRKETIKNAINNLTYNKDESSILLVTNEKEGLIGLIANKLMNDNNKPAICFCESTEDSNILKGSARSKDGFSISDTFSKLGNLLLNYGGHNLAGGLSISKDNLPLFKEEFNKIALNNPFIKKKENTIKIDLYDISKDNYEIYKSFKPFGMGFEKPSFKIDDIQVSSLSYTATGEHISTKLTNNTKLLGFNFNKNELDKYTKINIIGNLESNIFRKSETIVFKIFEIETK